MDRRGVVEMPDMPSDFGMLPHTDRSNRSQLLFLMARKNDLHLSVNLLRKWLRAARQPLRIWTSLTAIRGFISIIADIWSGLASISHQVIKYPKNLPEATLKVYFSG